MLPPTQASRPHLGHPGCHSSDTFSWLCPVTPPPQPSMTPLGSDRRPVSSTCAQVPLPQLGDPPLSAHGPPPRRRVPPALFLSSRPLHTLSPAWDTLPPSAAREKQAPLVRRPPPQPLAVKPTSFRPTRGGLASQDHEASAAVPDPKSTQRPYNRPLGVATTRSPLLRWATPLSEGGGQGSGLC